MGMMGIILDYIIRLGFFMIDKPFSEMKIGDVKISTGRTITETDIVNFAMIMGSWLELQTNDEFAKHTMYGKRIAQGPLVYTIAVGLLGYDGGILSALSGVDRLRMLAPTFIGDTLWSKGEIIDLIDREDEYGMVVVKLSAINQHDQTVMVCDLRLVCRKNRLVSPVGPK